MEAAWTCAVDRAAGITKRFFISFHRPPRTPAPTL
jgi:hypothetical protein